MTFRTHQPSWRTWFASFGPVVPLAAAFVVLLLVVGFGGNWWAVIAVVLISMFALAIGLLIGVGLEQSRSRSAMRRIQQTCGDALERLAVQEETNASLRASVDRHKQNADINAELAESHLAQLNELRALIAGRVAP
jgi:hypothetical protein